MDLHVRRAEGPAVRAVRSLGRPRWLLVLGLAGVVALVVASSAFAHARVSPAVSLSKELQLYSLAVPTEKANLTTTKIVMTVPKGFGIDSFVSTPGWTRKVQQQGSGEDAVIQQVTWTGGNTPTGEDSFFQFLAQPSSDGTYTFHVQQTYSDGSIVDWSGPESSDAPAPTIEAKSSLGGSTSTLTIVSIVLAAVALLVAIGGIVMASGKRQVA